MTGYFKYSLSNVAQVDPVALGIPNYNDYIPKENMRDLSLIQSKLEKDQYASIDAFEADIKLMTYNAILYNGADAPVSLSAMALEKLAVSNLNELRNRYSSTMSPQPSHKRASSTTSDSRSNKKSRIN